jgi:hypothetical protein
LAGAGISVAREKSKEGAFDAHGIKRGRLFMRPRRDRR